MRKKLYLQNLKCNGCANTIISKLSELQGADNIEVNVEESFVSFNLNMEQQLASVKNKLQSLGYPIQGDANSIISKSKSFISCASGKLK